MAARLRDFRRGTYLYLRLLGQEMKSILAYRADFVILLFSAVVVQLTGFAVIWTIFQRIPDINGWTFWQVVMMYSLIFITEGVGSMFFEGTWWLAYLVYSGELDQVLLRPVSPVVQILASRVGFNGMGNMVTGGALFAFALTRVEIQWTPDRILMLVLLIASAAMIRVALNLGTAALSFWINGPASMVPMVVHQLGEFAKYPITIYSVGIQAVIVVAIPFAFVSFFPTAYIFDVPGWRVAGLLTPLVAVWCLWLAVTIFRQGLRRYESSGH
jgi:ABC-2 type transport system permease protein